VLVWRVLLSLFALAGVFVVVGGGCVGRAVGVGVVVGVVVLLFVVFIPSVFVCQSFCCCGLS